MGAMNSFTGCRGFGTADAVVALRQRRIIVSAAALTLATPMLLKLLTHNDPGSLLAGHVTLAVLAGLSYDTVLSNPTRARILAHLKVLPGDHFRSIVRMLGLGVGDARHHLNVLLRNGLVREVRANGKCRYYVTGNGSDSERNELFAKHWGYRDVRLRVLFNVRNHGEATPASVAAALGISRQLAAYHLSSLVEFGLLRREHGRYRT